MGCDIHMVLEQRLPGHEWVGLWHSDYIPGVRGRPPIAQRDYGFFVEVAQVRGHSATGLYPRNLPVDVSRLAWLHYMCAPTDHHTPSYASLTEFLEAYARSTKHFAPGRADYRPEFAASDLLGIDPEWPEAEYRVVFWFDN